MNYIMSVAGFVPMELMTRVYPTVKGATPMWVTYASDVEPYLGRVWGDACDVGFKIFSKRTQAERSFVATDCLYQDGDLVWTDFTPTDKTTKMVVRVFNT